VVHNFFIYKINFNAYFRCNTFHCEENLECIIRYNFKKLRILSLRFFIIITFANAAIILFNTQRNIIINNFSNVHAHSTCLVHQNC